MRQELARHLHHQVTEISQQLDAILCGKQRHPTAGALAPSNLSLHEQKHLMPKLDALRPHSFMLCN